MPRCMPAVFPLVAAILLFPGVSNCGEETPWVKHKTTDIQLNHERQVMSPGLLDTDLQNVVKFALDGRPTPVGLPHAGQDAKGKSRPPLMGVFQNNYIWLDLNGDTRQSKTKSGKPRLASP